MLSFIPSHINKYAVYSLLDASGDTVYVGVERLIDIFALKNVRRAPSFDADATYTLIIHHFFDLSTPANVCAANILGNFKAPPKLNDELMMARKKRRIRCLRTGQTWATQAELCAERGHCQSNLSNHLAGKQGYRTVNGERYQYVTHDCPHLPSLRQPSQF